MPRSRQTRDSLLFRDRQGGPIPFGGEFLALLTPAEEEFTSTQALYEEYIALVIAKGLAGRPPSKTGFARFMARKVPLGKTYQNGLRGYRVKFHHE